MNCLILGLALSMHVGLENNYNQCLKVVISQSISNNELLQYVPSIDKAMNKLGLNVNIDLDTAIKKTKLFYLNK